MPTWGKTVSGAKYGGVVLPEHIWFEMHGPAELDTLNCKGCFVKEQVLDAFVNDKTKWKATVEEFAHAHKSCATKVKKNLGTFLQKPDDMAYDLYYKGVALPLNISIKPNADLHTFTICCKHCSESQAHTSIAASDPKMLNKLINSFAGSHESCYNLMKYEQDLGKTATGAGLSSGLNNSMGGDVLFNKEKSFEIFPYGDYDGYPLKKWPDWKNAGMHPVHKGIQEVDKWKPVNNVVPINHDPLWEWGADRPYILELIQNIAGGQLFSAVSHIIYEKLPPSIIKDIYAKWMYDPSGLDVQQAIYNLLCVCIKTMLLTDTYMNRSLKEFLLNSFQSVSMQSAELGMKSQGWNGYYAGGTIKSDVKIDVAILDLNGRKIKQ